MLTRDSLIGVSMIAYSALDCFFVAFPGWPGVVGHVCALNSGRGRRGLRGGVMWSIRAKTNSTASERSETCDHKMMKKNDLF
jgi:hypothetical protein